MNRSDRMRWPQVVIGAATALTLIAGCGNGSGPSPQASASRQQEVADRGAAVMPFDLERTTHRFAKAPDGGVQTVTADDPADTTQISLVRQHLQQETERFRRGDFADPARIHGDAMPGLAALRNAAGRIAVDYTEVTDGARITYTTTDPALVAALHAWFDAQVSDHGSHATHG